MTDRIEVCSFCGLFGAHKGHELTLLSDLRELVRTSLTEVTKDRQCLEPALGLESDTPLIDRVKNRLRDRMDVLRKDMEDEYNVILSEDKSELKKTVLDAV